MGKITRKVDPSAKSGIAPYDGPDPKPGMYRARIIKVAIRKARNTASLSYNVFYELEAAADKPDHAKYNGYSGFADLWMGDKEALIAREGTFYKAITGKPYKNVADVNVVFEGDEDDFATPAGAEVTKIDGKNPKGRVVKVNIQLEKGGLKDDDSGEKYEDRLRVSDIYPAADADTAGAKAGSSAEMEDDEMDDAPDFVQDAVAADDEELEDDADLEAEIEARRKELRGRSYGLAKLKEACIAAGIYEKGMDKTALVEAILKYEFEDEDGAEDADDEDEPSTASVVAAEDAADDEEEDEDDEEEDDEEEDDEDEDEDDPEAELRSEIADLDRAALKARIKSNDASVSIKKSMTDDDLRDIIVGQEITVSPF